MRSTRWAFIPLLAAVATASSAWGVTVVSTSFQNGVDGYAGAVDRRISIDKLTNPGTTREVNGGSVTNYIIDGYAAGANPGDPPASLDEQGLLRFDNIFGALAGQIPPGAFILDASLEIATHTAANSDSGGPFGVARLLQPFTSTTSYSDFPRVGAGTPTHRGAWWQDNYTARPSGGFGNREIGDPGSGLNATNDVIEPAQIRSIVQAWADGAANDGMVIQSGFSGQTNGWITQTTGNATAARRPKLNVSYTTDPIQVNTFQRGANGYAGDTMAWVRSGSVTTPGESTFDGLTGVGTVDPPLTSFQQFLDGKNATDSPDDLALIKFADVFGAGAGQASATLPVAKAWLVLTTGDASGNARSPGTYVAHSMLRDWTTSSLYSSFGATPGLSEADGDLGPLADEQFGMITGSEVWFDVTDYLEAVRNGATDYGLAILSGGTTDGWQIHFNGSAEAGARPRLVVASAVPEPATLVLAAGAAGLALAAGRRRA
jgi:hypothetical protein